MFPMQSMGYDRAITVFSPEGRLYQVEYATEAVRHGPLAVGVKAVDGVVLAGEKRPPSPLADLETLKKILIIDDHVGTAIAGLHADARKLIDRARVQAQINRLSYNEPISIYALVMDLCDIKQLYTQYGGYRPFGVSLLVGGVDDDGPHLYLTDPSGSFWGWKAAAIGRDAEAVKDFFRKSLDEQYREGIQLTDAVKLAVRAILQPGQSKTAEKVSDRSKTIEVGLVSTKDRQFRMMSKDQVAAVVSEVTGS
ncbi:MAG: archaeal proteasome endopeptidase complex subunit alpha [Candidatus Thorarchaeota archaeon]